MPIPEQFFGQGGHADVFLATHPDYDELLFRVRAHIEYLKNGGDPHASRYHDDENEEDWDDEDEE